MNKKIIIANWKMHPNTLAEAESLYHFSCDSCIAGGNNAEVIVCPPFVYLEALSKIESSTGLGAQNCHWEQEGAFTGEVSPVMLKQFGVKYVILGHSERRWKMNEDDEMINEKMKAVLNNDMTPILAVGERKKDEDREHILIDQISKNIGGIDREDIDKIIIAYEPVWTISTTKDKEKETPEHALEAFKIIKDILNKLIGEEINIPILYGGSVDSKNVGSFVSKPEIAGVLVGGASINKEEFGKIIEIVSGIKS